MKTIPAITVTLLLAFSAHAQLPAPAAVDPLVVTSNALQRAIQNNDTARINLLSNALQRMIARRSGAAQTPAVTRPATPPPVTPITPVARPAAPAVQPANPAAPPPNVAGAAAPAPGGAAVPRVGAGAAGQTGPFSGDPDEIVFPAGQLKLQEADLDPVLTIYQELTGRTVLRPANLPAAKITIKSQTELTRRQAIQALDTLLAMNQITMVPQGELFVKAVPQAEAFQAGGQFNDIPTELLPEASMFVTEVVQLKNATPNDILPVIQPFAKLPGSSIITVPSANLLVLRDYAENVKRMVEMIEKVDVVPIQEFEPVVIPIKYALATDMAQVLSSLTEGGGSATTVGQQQTSAGLSSGGFGSRGGMGGIGGYGGSSSYGGYGGYGGYNNRMNPLGTVGGIGSSGLSSAAAGRSSFANRLRQIVNRAATGNFAILGQTEIIADERTNALLIFASKQDLISISNIIEKLDVVLPQVLIDAVVMEVSLDDSLNYGFSYIQREPSTFKDFTGLGAIVNNNLIQGIQNFPNIGSNFSSGFTYMARIGGFDAAMAAIANDSRINVIQRPRIQTSHAVEANLFVGETRPYPTGTYGGYGTTYSSIQQLQIGLTLSVLPLINPDGLVVMDIRERVQTIGGEVNIEGVGSVPSTIDREANAKVSVRDGETIVLGGFISNEKRKSKSGVPILKDIPIFGALFRTANDSSNRRELMIFIRPTVLPNPEEAAIAAKREKENMPLLTSGERELNRDTDRIRRYYDEQAKKDAAMDKRQEDRDKKKEQKEHDDLLKREGLKP